MAFLHRKPKTEKSTELENYKFFTKEQYFDELVRLLEDAKMGDKVLVQSMSFNPKIVPVIRILDALCAAANRGVEVQVMIDAFNFLSRGSLFSLGPMYFSPDKTTGIPGFQDKRAQLRRLKKCGAHVVITNPPTKRFNMPVVGRSHIKLAVFNDLVFLGGCDLISADAIDFMVRIHDPHLALTLREYGQAARQQPSIRAVLNGKDKKIEMTDGSTVYIDAGVPKQSAILAHALEQIDKAEKWLTYSSQFFPHGVTAQHLKKAYQRGVKVKIIYSKPYHHMMHKGLIEGGAQLAHETHSRIRLPKELFQNGVSRQTPYSHGKVLATENGALIGSHNYIFAGVKFGTAEVALWRPGEDFAKKAAAAMTEQLHSPA